MLAACWHGNHAKKKKKEKMAQCNHLAMTDTVEQKRENLPGNDVMCKKKNCTYSHLRVPSSTYNIQLIAYNKYHTMQWIHICRSNRLDYFILLWSSLKQ